MKRLMSFCVVATLATVLTLPVFAQSEQQLKRERVTSSYMLTFGRQPNSGELSYWVGRENLSVSQLVNLHNQYLQSNNDEKRKVVTRSFKDSYGYNLNEGDIKKNMLLPYNYSQWMENHLNFLRSNSQAWNDMIAKVYWNVCNRGATDNDRRSWKQNDAKPYYLIAGVVDKWNKENSGSRQLKLDGNSNFVNVFNISNTVAREVAGVVAAGGGNVIAAGGGNVIAAGGGNVVAAGGGNAVAAGGGN